MMKHKTSGSKYDRIFSNISSGRSFSDLGSQAITDGSEQTSFLLLHEDDAADAICTWSYTVSKILKHK